MKLRSRGRHITTRRSPGRRPAVEPLEGRALLSVGFSNLAAPPQAASGEALTLGPDGNLWFVEQDNAIGKMTPAGKVTSYPIPGASASSRDTVGVIAPGPDGNLWFADPSERFIDRITPAGAISRFPIPFLANDGTTPSLIEHITAGPDGDVWFTETDVFRYLTPEPSTAYYVDVGHVAKVSPAGVVTDVYTSSGFDPGAITEGPDGNLWFAAKGNPSIGGPAANGAIDRMTPEGVVTTFNLPAGLGQVPGQSDVAAIGTGISAAPGGSLEFSYQASITSNEAVDFLGEPISLGLARISTKGVITQVSVTPTSVTATDSNFPIYNGQGDPESATVGPEFALDGTTWLANPDELVRVSTTGVVNTFAPLTVSSNPTTIVLGPGGDLYYNATGGPAILGRIVPDSTTPAPLLTPLQPVGSVAETFKGALAKFTVNDPKATAASYSAVINWLQPAVELANGPTYPKAEQDPGVIVANGQGGYTIYGGPRLPLGGDYLGDGDVQYTVTVFDSDTVKGQMGSAATVSGVVNTAFQPIIDTNASDSLVTDGSVVPSGSGLVATFTTNSAYTILGALSATIDWGDGTPDSLATIRVSPPTGTGSVYTLVVSATHTDARPGAYVVKVSLLGSKTAGQPLAIEDGLSVAT